MAFRYLGAWGLDWADRIKGVFGKTVIGPRTASAEMDEHSGKVIGRVVNQNCERKHHALRPRCRFGLHLRAYNAVSDRQC